jgi:hypothetical protein
VWALWCSIGLPGTVWASGVEVHGSSECLDPRATESALAAVIDELRPHAKAKLKLQAAVSLAGDNVDASLNLFNEAGETLLKRRYQLTRADCPELREFYVLVVGEFLRELPAEDWRKLVEPPSKPLPSWRIGLEGGVELGLSTKSTSGALGLWGELGDGEQRFMTVLWAEGTTWRTMAEGEYRVVTSLVGAGWRSVRGDWSGELLMMGGLGRIAGRGYQEDKGAWVPWVELVGAGGVSVGAVRLGGRLSLVPIQHEVATHETEEVETLPAVELGLSIQVPL